MEVNVAAADDFADDYVDDSRSYYWNANTKIRYKKRSYYGRLTFKEVST